MLAIEQKRQCCFLHLKQQNEKDKFFALIVGAVSAVHDHAHSLPEEGGGLHGNPREGKGLHGNPPTRRKIGKFVKISPFSLTFFETLSVAIAFMI